MARHDGISSLRGEGGLEIKVSAVSSSWLGNTNLWRCGRGRELVNSAGRLREVRVLLLAIVIGSRFGEL